MDWWPFNNDIKAELVFYKSIFDRIRGEMKKCDYIDVRNNPMFKVDNM